MTTEKLTVDRRAQDGTRELALLDEIAVLRREMRRLTRVVDAQAATLLATVTAAGG